MQATFRYTWALDGHDVLVRLDDVAGILRSTGETPRCFCPGCNREMTVAIDGGGAVRLVHGAGNGCGMERYLNGLAKLLLKERFDKGEPLSIALNYPTQCREFAACPFYDENDCRVSAQKVFDLRKIYDRADLDAVVPTPENSDRVQADLVFSDSRGKHPPMAFLFRPAFFLDPPAIPEGLLLVEVPVDSESDVERLISEPIREMPAVSVMSSLPVRTYSFFLGPFKRKAIIRPGCPKAGPWR